MSIEVVIPPYLQPQAEQSTLVDDGTVIFRPTQAPGVTQRNSLGEPHLRVKQTYANLSGADRGSLLSALRRAQGRLGTIRALVGYARRGAMSASEILTNNNFTNGTTGWTSSNVGKAVVDNRMRVSMLDAGVSTGALQQSPALTQGTPYCLRVILIDGRNSPLAASLGGITVRGCSPNVSIVAAAGMNKITMVASVTGSSFSQDILSLAASASTAIGDYVEIPWVSMARCALVDNGGNSLVRSEAFDNASWTKTRCSITADFSSSPGPNTTAGDLLVEDTTATSTHEVTQAGITISSTANVDYCFSCYVRPNARGWVRLSMIEGSSSHEANCYFQLSSTGAVGTSGSTGSNWTNVRGTINAEAGSNQWYRCVIVASKQSAATSITVRIRAATADNGDTYTGTSSSAIIMWGANFTQSSVASRYTPTTNAAVLSAQQTGSGLYLKGLPASTSGLVLADDVVEVGNELKQATSQLTSDGVGQGYLQFAPALFRSPLDNDPVVVQQPMGKFILANDPSWQNNLGVYADIDVELDHIYE